MSLIGRIRRAAARRTPVRATPSRLAAPVASLTFDDFPRSAWTIGGPILEAYGARATYYLSGRFCGAHEDGLDYYQAEDLAPLAAAGHELACHTFSHINGATTAWPALQADIARNARFLEAATGAAPRNFAYPYGDISVAAKRRCGAAFRSSRGICPGLNAGRLDLGQLRSFPLEARSYDPAVVAAAVRQAAEAPAAWLTFFSHDVSDTPSPYGCTPQMLRFVLDLLRDHGLPAVTVDQALDRAGI
jgi:peptidoglycan/xylan/chitin deacetylase (PgdA/CDA1 family)